MFDRKTFNCLTPKQHYLLLKRISERYSIICQALMFGGIVGVKGDTYNEFEKIVNDFTKEHFRKTMSIIS